MHGWSVTEPSTQVLYVWSVTATDTGMMWSVYPIPERTMYIDVARTGALGWDDSDQVATGDTCRRGASR